MIFLLQVVGAPMVGRLPQEIKIELPGNLSDTKKKNVTRSLISKLGSMIFEIHLKQCMF